MEEDNFTEDKLIILGKILKTHGVIGNFVLLSFCSEAENIFTYTNLYIFEEKKFLTNDSSFEKIKNENFLLKKIKLKKIKNFKENSFIAKFKDVNNINHLTNFINKNVLAYSSEIFKNNKNDDEEIFMNELIGMNVYSENDFLGKVTALMNFGAGDIIEIEMNNKKQLIPSTKNAIKNIDKKNKKILVDSNYVT